MMTTVNGPERANRGAATGRSPTQQPATDHLCEQAREVTQELQGMGNTAGDAVRENLGKLQDEASECYEQGRDQAYKAEQTFEQYIKDHPLKSILIAAGVGMFLGRFWIRR
jgi:ElaB/YqjD/DUF883 family membrane-anchored ribosome-binding protein